jgi:hypothetical protein
MWSWKQIVFLTVQTIQRNPISSLSVYMTARVSLQRQSSIQNRVLSFIGCIWIVTNNITVGPPLPYFYTVFVYICVVCIIYSLTCSHPEYIVEILLVCLKLFCQLIAYIWRKMVLAIIFWFKFNYCLFH